MKYKSKEAKQGKRLKELCFTFYSLRLEFW